MKSGKNRSIQFVSDNLVQQIIDGRKTASVVDLGEVDVGDGDFDDPLVVGDYYDVFDSSLVARTTIPGHGIVPLGRHPRTSVAWRDQHQR